MSAHEPVIVVTDSGIGGMSVAADVARRARQSGRYPGLSIIFYNALYARAAGYNSLTTRAQKIRVFTSALEDMHRRYRPDMILVACNTLSVLLPDIRTSFAETPVLGIVEAGVELLASALTDNPAASALVFGTATTIEEGMHRRALLERGFADDRMVFHACPDLAGSIERNPAGEETGRLIRLYVSEAMAKLQRPRDPVLVSLNCTHFGYARPFWIAAARDAGANLLGVLDPNERMADVLFPAGAARAHNDPRIDFTMVSMVAPQPTAVEPLCNLLGAISADAAEGLRNWQHVPDLFQWQFDGEQ